jgi:hypothetical protein
VCCVRRACGVRAACVRRACGVCAACVWRACCGQGFPNYMEDNYAAVLRCAAAPPSDGAADASADGEGEGRCGRGDVSLFAVFDGHNGYRRPPTRCMRARARAHTHAFACYGPPRLDQLVEEEKGGCREGCDPTAAYGCGCAACGAASPSGAWAAVPSDHGPARVARHSDGGPRGPLGRLRGLSLQRHRGPVPVPPTHRPVPKPAACSTAALRGGGGEQRPPRAASD